MEDRPLCVPSLAILGGFAWENLGGCKSGLEEDDCCRGPEDRTASVKVLELGFSVGNSPTVGWRAAMSDEERDQR